MAFRGLRADSRDVQAGSQQLRMQVTDRAGLAGTSGSEVGRVEVEDQGPVAQQRAQRRALVVLVRQRKFRRTAADRQHGVISPRKTLEIPQFVMIAASFTIG